MDTQNPTKGKKGLWIKIVAAVVIVGALVTVGVLGMQGDWLQGSIRSLSKPVLKTTTTTTVPKVTAPLTETKTTTATTKTVTPVCGNSKVESGEKCDDGNTKSLDGCSSKCVVEPDLCLNINGNQYVVPVGYTLSGTTCTSNIITDLEAEEGPTFLDSVCGNGIKEGSEACDDKNSLNGDGCSSTCQVEPGFTCHIDIETDKEGRKTLSPSICVPQDVPPPEDVATPLMEDTTTSSSPVTITSNPPATDNKISLTYPAKVTFTRSKLPFDTIATEWGYDQNYFTCIPLPVVGSEIEKLECTPKTVTGAVYSGFSFNWCVTGNICQWSNYIYVRVLPSDANSIESSTETILQVQ